MSTQTNVIIEGIKEMGRNTLEALRYFFLTLWEYSKPIFTTIGETTARWTTEAYTYLSIHAPPFIETFIRKTQVLFSALFEQELLTGLFFAIIGIGILNWTIWLTRRARSTFYTPFTGVYHAETSVVIPVYKEKKHILKDTVDSILRNNPTEVILVLDSSETELMHFLTTEYEHNHKIKTHFISTPGKRPALAKGIRLAKSDIVVLVDSDTAWKGRNFLTNLIIPFKDPSVGGVGTRQEVSIRESWAQKVIDWNLFTKYSDYIKSDSLSGSVLCLSGRTAAYRRDIVLPVLDKLTDEYFLGHHCLGGDDTRLTSLVLMQGYNTVYQDICVAQSEFHPSMKVYLKQKIRWSRNSFRAYLRAIFSKWPWKQRRYIYIISAYHTIFPGITALLGLVFFFYALYLQLYIFAYIWIAWAVLGRFIKGYSYLKKYPKEIYLLPAVVTYYYTLSFIKLYAFLTMTRESWSGSRKGYKIKKGQRVTA